MQPKDNLKNTSEKLASMLNELNTPFTRIWMDYKMPLSQLNAPTYENKVKCMVNDTIGKNFSNDQFLEHVSQMTIDYLKENDIQPKYNQMIYIAISTVLREAFESFYGDGCPWSDCMGAVREKRESWLKENFPTEIARQSLRTAISSTIGVKFHNDFPSKKMLQILVPVVEAVLADAQPKEIRQNIISNAISEAVKNLFDEDSNLTKYLLGRERI